MKHAILSDRKRIMRVLEEANDRTVEITDEQAEQVAALKADNKPAILFEGAVTNFLIERDAGFNLQWNVEQGAWTKIHIPVIVPNEVTNYQLKQALNATPADRAAVDALIAGSGDQNTIDGWQYAGSFKRDNPLFQGAIAYLGWSAAKVDALMILAATFK